MTDIFLSYAEKDRPTAARIGALLEQAGWTVWWDRKIPAGKTWRDVLEEALQNMRCMVVLWSSYSIKSEWVKEEAEEGKSQRKLIPILIEPVTPPVGFRSIQAADFSTWDGSSHFPAARQLIADLESILGKPARSRAQLDAPAKPASLSSATREQHELRFGTLVNSALTARWRQQVQRRSLGATAALVAVLIAAPLTRVQVPSSASDPNRSVDPVRVKSTELITDEVDVEPAAAAPNTGITKTPLQRSTPTSEVHVPVIQPDPRARATPVSSNPRCSEILARAQLGEPLADEIRKFLQKECQ